MLQTLERNVHTFDAQVLTPAGAAALAELTGPAGLPFLPPDRQRTALENGRSSRIMLASRSCRRPPP